MEFVTWLDELSVGVKLFDDDHKKLVGFVNKLHMGMKSGEGIASMTGVLDGLVNYTVEHFKHEEDLFKEHSYPGYEAHKNEHQALVKKVGEFQEQLQQGKSSFTFELMIFLRDWLVNHIKGTDMKYKAFFQEKGIA